MEEKKKQKLFDKKRADRGPNQRLRQRTAVLIILILVVGFGATLLRLSFLTMVQGSELQEKAVGQQLSDTVLTAKRGSIYDAKGTTLAESASVWQVVLAPINFDDDKQREAAARGLSEILGLDYENVLEKTQQKNYYTVVKRKIEVEQRDKVIELMKTLTKEYDCGSVIQLLDDYKRYYPKDTLASAVIGFTGADEQGLEGVEYKYDKYLSGTPGRIITAKNARGTNMPFQYEQNVESENGNNIYLTIDETIQSICEKYVAQAVIDNNVMNRAGCICMDVNTAAILAMVTSDGYNLNDPYQLPSSEVDRIKQLPKEEQDKEESKALAAMWRNKCVADTYMPGSVFKMCTASMALEEGKIKDNSSFTCGGYMRVEDYDIGCSVTSGHGTQTFLESFCHSCNPAFIQIGQLVGIDKFRDYYTAFGFSEKSGIDLPGEADDSFWPEGQMGMVDLAVASFGQNFSITPLSMITACAAVSNGGYVLQPYVVSKITDADGNVVKTMERKVKGISRGQRRCRRRCSGLQGRRQDGYLRENRYREERQLVRQGLYRVLLRNRSDGRPADRAARVPRHAERRRLLRFPDRGSSVHGDHVRGSAVSRNQHRLQGRGPRVSQRERGRLYQYILRGSGYKGIERRLHSRNRRLRHDGCFPDADRILQDGAGRHDRPLHRQHDPARKGDGTRLQECRRV